MRVDKCVGCTKFPCTDVKHECYLIPVIDIKPENFSVMMISEAAPENPKDYYYAKGNPLFVQTTVQAFKDAGAAVESIEDILGLGVYLTTAVKCGKTGYGIKSKTIEECSLILQKELALFPNVRAFMLMGDVAIKALNYIAKREGEERVIPAGSTYKIRDKKYFYKKARAFPPIFRQDRASSLRRVKER